jgi:oligosaccharide repeat unit polymerase
MNDFITAQLLGLLGIVALSAPILIFARRSHRRPFSLNVIAGGLGPFAGLGMGLIISIVGVSLTGAGFGNTSELAVRDFAGSGYVYALNYGAIAGILCFLLLIKADHLNQRRYQIVAFGAAALAVGIYAGFLGGRSEPITLIIAAVAIFALRSNGVSRHLLVAGALALIVLSVSYRVVVREAFFQENEGVSTSQLLEQSADSPFSALVGGQDISAFDKLIALRSEWESKPLLGSTILATAVRWIPSETSFARMEGGNEVFTSTLYPERYRAGNGLDGVSILGEGYINFGTAGVALVALGVGFVIAILHIRAYDGPLSMAAYALALARVPGLIRGDMLHVTIGFALPLFWTFVILSLLAYSYSRSQSVSQAQLIPAQ